MAACLILLFQNSVAAQSLLDPRTLSNIPDPPFAMGQPNHELESERIEIQHIADNPTNISPFLVRTSTPLPPPIPSNTLAEIYFDWNRERLKADAGKIVAHTADLLQQDSRKRVELQAICDERGSEAYNLTLGWKRSSLIKEYLRNLEIPTTQVIQVSYGTHPLCLTQSTNCMQESQDYREAFRLLSMAVSRSGCLVQLRLKNPQRTAIPTDPTTQKPFLQRIHLAEIR